VSSSKEDEGARVKGEGDYDKKREGERKRDTGEGSSYPDAYPSG